MILIRVALYSIVLLLVLCASSHTKELAEYVWNISAVYSSDSQWEADRDLVTRKMQTIGRHKTTMATSAKAMADALEEISDLRRRAGKLAIYGFLTSDVDTESTVARKQYEVGTGLESQVEAAVAFAGFEVRKVGKERMQEWMEKEPRLKKHAARINRFFAEAPFSVDSQSQSILETAARWPRLSGDAFEELHSADLGFPQIRTADGKDLILSRSGYYQLRRQNHSAERTFAMKKYLESLKRFEDVFALLYVRRIEADLLLAKHRGFQDGMDAIWFLRDGMPAGSSSALVAATRKNLSPFHSLSRIRAEFAGAQLPSYADLYAAPQHTADPIPVEHALEIALEASKPLGPEYITLLRNGIAQQWMHLAPAKNKSATYAIWPPVAGIPPYVIMTYNGDHDSARRLLGALTLMITFENWRNSNPPDSRDDSGIYSNGVIYVGDLLFDDYMVENARNSQERRALAVHSFDFLRHHYFHWAMNSEFDHRVQELIIQGNPPNGARLTEMYLEILREYYGHDRGGVQVDEMFGREWMINSVPFVSFEHQFWPAAVAVGCNIVERLKRGDPQVQQAVYRLLGQLDVDRTFPMLLRVGLDMSKPSAYDPVFARAAQLLNELK